MRPPHRSLSDSNLYAASSTRAGRRWNGDRPRTIDLPDAHLRKFVIDRFDWHRLLMHFRSLKIQEMKFGKSEWNAFLLPDMLRLASGTIFNGLCYNEILKDRCKSLVKTDEEETAGWESFRLDWAEKSPYFEVVVEALWDKYAPSMILWVGRFFRQEVLFAGGGLLLGTFFKKKEFRQRMIPVPQFFLLVAV